MPESPPLFPSGNDTFEAIHNEIKKASDRVAALLAHSVLEVRMKQAIRSRFAFEDKPAKELLGSVDKGGELSFRYQCDLAQCLGLFGDITRKELALLSGVRNRFAHTLAILDFSDPSIRDRCQQLVLPGLLHSAFNIDGGPPTEPRMKYTRSVYLIVTLLWTAIETDGKSGLP